MKRKNVINFKTLWTSLQSPVNRSVASFWSNTFQHKSIYVFLMQMLMHTIPWMSTFFEVHASVDKNSRRGSIFQSPEAKRKGQRSETVRYQNASKEQWHARQTTFSTDYFHLANWHKLLQSLQEDVKAAPITWFVDKYIERLDYIQYGWDWVLLLVKSWKKITNVSSTM